jgi:hypothetical protein
MQRVFALTISIVEGKLQVLWKQRYTTRREAKNSGENRHAEGRDGKRCISKQEESLQDMTGMLRWMTDIQVLYPRECSHHIVRSGRVGRRWKRRVSQPGTEFPACGRPCPSDVVARVCGGPIWISPWGLLRQLLQFWRHSSRGQFASHTHTHIS